MKKNKGTNMGIERMSITLPHETKDKLDQLAKNESRSRSNMIRVLIDERYELEKHH